MRYIQQLDRFSANRQIDRQESQAKKQESERKRISDSSRVVFRLIWQSHWL